MDYIEVSMTGLSAMAAEILPAELTEFGFEAFSEEEDGKLSAFIPSRSFDMMPVANFLEVRSSSMGFSYTLTRIPDRNWNAVWESGYEPVFISGRCMIRAPFHKPCPDAVFDLVIEPKMSFGTAHHETTRLMIETVLGTDIRGRKVLDMGCGTGVLAILACKMGAARVVAVDNDEWAYINAVENAARNNAGEIIVIQGDVSVVKERDFDVILANINRNVLLGDIPSYQVMLAKGGVLILSGFYTADLQAIIDKTRSLGLQNTNFRELNKWVVATFTK